MVRKVHCFVYENVWYGSFSCICMCACERGLEDRSKQVRVFEALPGSFLLCLLLKGGGGLETVSGRMHRCTLRISRLWTRPRAEKPESQHLSLRLEINATSWSPGSEYQRRDEVLGLVAGSEIKHVRNPTVFALIRRWRRAAGCHLRVIFRWRFSLFVQSLTTGADTRDGKFNQLHGEVNAAHFWWRTT